MGQHTVADIIRDHGNHAMISIDAGATVAEAVEIMAAREIGAMLAMNEDGLVSGIFSERDLLARVVRPGLDPKSTPLSLVMTRDVRFVSPGTTTEAALSLMHLLGFRHLLVIDGPHVHGIISMRDLVFQMLKRGEGRFEAAVRDAGTGSEA